MKVTHLFIACIVFSAILGIIGISPVLAQDQNSYPYTPQVEILPTSPSTTDDLMANILGPSPADPDGDTVDYLFQWYSWSGGEGRWVLIPGETSQILQSSNTEEGDEIRVGVTARDPYGAESPTAFVHVTIQGIVSTNPSSWGSIKAIYK